MKKILLTCLSVGMVFAGATFTVSSITSTADGFDIQIDYMSDTVIGGYQFDFLSEGSLTVTGATGGASDAFDGITVGNNVVLAFSFSGTTLPVVSVYSHLITLSTTVNNGSDGANVLLEAKNDCTTPSDCASRLVVSDATGGSVEADFHEAAGTVGTDNFTLDNEIVNPISFSLGNNYPNPFNPNTVIEFSIAEPSIVNLSIFDASGRLVKTLVSESRSVGAYTQNWDGTSNNGINVSAGIYLYKIEAGSFIETKKMLLVK